LTIEKSKMRNIAAILALGVTYHTAEAKLDSCGFNTSDMKLFYGGVALGVQENHTDRTTDCYSKTDVLATQTKQFFDSFTNWKYDDWANPLYVGAELSTASTDLYTACQTTELAK
jgi:hypothetical protein